MTPGQRPPIDLELVRQLQAQGVPLQQIANRLKLPRSTLRDQLKRALPAKTTDVDIRGATDVHVGVDVRRPPRLDSRGLQLVKRPQMST